MENIINAIYTQECHPVSLSCSDRSCVMLTAYSIKYTIVWAMNRGDSKQMHYFLSAMIFFIF